MTILKLKMATSYTCCKYNNSLTYSTVDWGNNGLVCFATCQAVAIYELGMCTGRVVQTLHGHLKEVQIVQWIRPRNGEPETELLSSDLSTITIWSKNHQDNTFERTWMLRLKSKYISALQLTDDATSTNPRVLIFVISLYKLKIYLREKCNGTKVVQTFNYRNDKSIPKSCCVTHLPGTNHLLLAVLFIKACTILYIADEENLNFFPLYNLTKYKHNSSIRKSAIFGHENGRIFIAEISNDSYLNIWNIKESAITLSKDDLFKTDLIVWFFKKWFFKESAVTSPKDNLCKIEMKTEASFTINDEEYNIVPEVRIPYKGSPRALHWWPTQQEGKNAHSTRLALSFEDRILIMSKSSEGVWEEKEIWLSDCEIGDNFLVYGFHPDGKKIFGRSTYGRFHIWEYSQEITKWLPRSLPPTGHINPVLYLCWDPTGSFLFTFDKKRETKIHALWKNKNEELWHEVGHFKINKIRLTFNEIRMRIIVMITPNTFACLISDTLYIIKVTFAFTSHPESLTDAEDFKSLESHKANAPSSDLMDATKLAKQIMDYKTEQNSLPNVDVYEFHTEPELEVKYCIKNSIKVESMGFLVSCIAARHDGSILAIAGQYHDMYRLEKTAIKLYETNSFFKIQTIPFYTWLLKQIEFSPNNKYLVVMYQDGTCILFQEINARYVSVGFSSEPNLFIEICCAWTGDSSYFARGGMNSNQIKIWSSQQSNGHIICKKKLTTKYDKVTALSFGPSCASAQSYILAIGFEIGCIDIYFVNAETFECTRLIGYNTSEAHHLAVKRLTFRPTAEDSPNKLCLASCSSDTSVKIRDIDILSLLKKNNLT